MLMSARIRVRDGSMMRFFMSSKLRHPDPPGSTNVVTPDRKLNPSGITALFAAPNSMPTVGR